MITPENIKEYINHLIKQGFDKEHVKKSAHILIDKYLDKVFIEIHK